MTTSFFNRVFTKKLYRLDVYLYPKTRAAEMPLSFTLKHGVGFRLVSILVRHHNSCSNRERAIPIRPKPVS